MTATTVLPETVARFRNREITLDQLAAQLNVSISTAWSALLRAGYMPRTQRRKKVPRRPLIPLFRRFHAGEISRADFARLSRLTTKAAENAILEIRTMLEIREQRKTVAEHRVAKMMALYRSGATLADLKAKFKVSRQRIQNLLATYYRLPKYCRFILCSECSAEMLCKGEKLRWLLCPACAAKLLKETAQCPTEPTTPKPSANASDETNTGATACEP